MRDLKKIVIIGAGPCGLGAAWRLHELGYSDWDIYEMNPYVGGLSASFVDDRGFTWDIGGHVHFSHYDYFDKLMTTLIPDYGWISHERESWIWMRHRFIPYPLQYNIGKLPPHEMMECLAGLINCKNSSTTATNFHDWILHTFGEGIARHFLIPYNKKVWAYPLEELSVQWMGERVAVPEVSRVINNILHGRDDCSWGPNNTFKFPRHGATGSIWQAVAERLPRDRIHLQARLISIDCTRKILRFNDGSDCSYDYLISTIPLDRLLSITEGFSCDQLDLFKHSSSHIIGIGIKGEPPEKLRTKCWMYFPEDDNPFYRVTVFSNYSPHNVPAEGYWSLMGEVSESPLKPVDCSRLLDEALTGFYNTRLIERNDTIVSMWTYCADYAYPTPFLRRDEVITKYLAQLKQHNIYSRGRFGAWKYECSNQDHVLMQGVEAVEHILYCTPEITLNYPSLVNSHRIR